MTKHNMSKSFLRLDKRRVMDDGTYPVKIVIGKKNGMMIGTGISVHPDMWDQKAQRVIGDKRTTNALISILTRARSVIMELIDRNMFESVSKEGLRRAIQTGCADDAKDTVTYKKAHDAFMQTKRDGRTTQLYEKTLKKVEAFQPDVLLDDITPTWLSRFDKWLGGEVNGRAIHLRNIRAVFNHALDEEMTEKYPFRKFKIKKEETRKRALTVEQLRAYIQLDDLTPQEAEYRDMFLLTFYLIGINTVDLSEVETLHNGRLEYKRAKTGKSYSIKVEPEAQYIIDKYAGARKLLEPFERYKYYRDYNHKLNDSMKKLGKVSGKARNGVKKRTPIEPDCSIYWARHTWATIAYSIGIPEEVIADALGHSHGNRVTAIYIDKSLDRVDEANRKVIDYVLQL